MQKWAISELAEPYLPYRCAHGCAYALETLFPDIDGFQRWIGDRPMARAAKAAAYDTQQGSPSKKNSRTARLSGSIGAYFRATGLAVGSTALMSLA